MTNRYDSVYTQGQGITNQNQDIVKGIGFSNSHFTISGNNIAENDINILNTGSTEKFNNHENVRYRNNERLINFNKEF